MMDIGRIDQRLRDAQVESSGKLHWFDTLGSTNDFILYELEDYHASVCLAAQQTAGRGRRGRSWQSAPGQGIYLSIGWALRGVSPQGLSLVCGLSVLNALLAQHVRRVTLKWPNDILLEQKKLAGILVELNGKRCVIGIGLNVKLPMPSHSTRKSEIPWTGLAAHGYEPDCELLIATLIANLNQDLGQFCQEGFAPYVEQWNSFHAFHGAEVDIVTGKKYHGLVKGVNHEGALCLETMNGIKLFHAGEVSLQIPATNSHGR